MTNETNNRVTTREFLKAQIDTQNMIHDLRVEVMTELKPLSKICNQVDTNKRDIDKLQTRSNTLDVFNGILAAIFATLAALLGRP